METQEKQLEFLDNLLSYTAKRNKELPDVTAVREAMGNVIYKDGALSRKVKRLIAMAVAIGIGCTPCIIAQTKMAVEAGASKEDVLEAASVLLAIHGTSGYSESWRVVKVLEELGLM